METLFLNSKRKKRRTRKCLDELRERSRRTSITGDVINKKIPQAFNSSYPTGVKRGKNNFITSKRLTLTMFAKAVRSETVTRPLINVAKHGPLPNFSINSPIIPPVNSIQMVNSKNCGDSTQMCTESDNVKHSDLENVRDHSENSSDSMILFSSVSKMKRHLYRDSANEETIPTATSTSITSDRSIENFGYHLYEELIEDIPIYLRRNLPNLIKEDVMKKTKSHLQNIYFENLQKQYESHLNNDPNVTQDRITSHRSCTSNEVIIRDPMDYIKIGWQQTGQHSCNESSASNAEVSLPQTPHTLCSAIVSPQLHSVLSHAPDYEYFPHRLND